MSQRTVRVLAPAKVNLFLAVGERLPDGYHRLDSVFSALELHDEIQIRESEALSLECTPSLDLPDEQNLVYRAAESIARAFSRTPLVSLRLTKRIPHGAGLGGGSSDAAAVIAGLAHLWGLDVDDERCTQVAAELGADVPFFLHEGPMLMTGRGDRAVRRLPAFDAAIVLVRPPFPVATADAYRLFDCMRVPEGDVAGVLEALETGDAEQLGQSLSNNLAPVAVELVPAVGEALAFVGSAAGVYGATVAGSGSAVFGVVENAAMAHHVAESARTMGWWAEATRLRKRGVELVDEEGSA